MLSKAMTLVENKMSEDVNEHRARRTKHLMFNVTT